MAHLDLMHQIRFRKNRTSCRQLRRVCLLYTSALERLGSTVEHAVYIGDSEVDAATARNAGMDCILVSWGFRKRELLASYDPVAIADQPSDKMCIRDR